MTRTVPPVVLLAVLLLVGCSRPPQEAVQRARQALADARAAEAGAYAPDALATAVAAEERMDRELAAQERRPALLRRYEAARLLAVQTAESAAAAADESADAREQLRSRLEPELPALRDALPVAELLVRKAGLIGGTRLDPAELTAEIRAIEGLVTDALRAWQEGRYRDAAGLATEAKTRLDEVQRTVQDALESAGGS